MGKSIIKKTAKKIVKKLIKEKGTPPKGTGHAPIIDEKYNEFGVCIACQGGDPNCHHQNLAYHNGHLMCVTCGKCIK